MTSEFAISVHALVYLDHKAKILSSEELAENICTNAARVRKVMTKLKKKGLVSTREGIRGGYQSAKDAKDIRLDQVCEALEAEPVNVPWKSGNVDMDCMVASGMSDVMEDIYAQMNDLCKEYLKTVTIYDVGRKLGLAP